MGQAYAPTRLGAFWIFVFMVLVLVNIVHYVVHPAASTIGSWWLTLLVVAGINVVAYVMFKHVRGDTIAFFWLSVLYLAAFGVRWFQ